MRPSDRLLKIEYGPADAKERHERVRADLMATSRRLRQPNFQIIAAADVKQMYGLYDRHFFDGSLSELVRQRAGDRMTFRLSSRMSRVGGTTTRRLALRGPNKGQTSYEITLATRLLFHTFVDVSRPVRVCGLMCDDRLRAMQHVFEHELVHLIEYAIWDDSSCAAERFKRLCRRYFAHADTKHDLVTPRERAAVAHGVKVGAAVVFDVDGRKLRGVVNRVTHRATVLVEDPAGARYSNGKRYVKYYVPVSHLEAVSA